MEVLLVPLARRAIFAAVNLFLLGSFVYAQPELVTFEVASIKPTPLDAKCGIIQPLPGGVLRIECVDLKDIISWAYMVQPFQVSGGPAWITSQRWDILAKTQVSGTTANELTEADEVPQNFRGHRRRLQALLADRFQLKVHRESKDMPVYILSVAKTGSKLRSSTGNTPGNVKGGPGLMMGQAATMEALASFLVIDLKRPVIDHTGLTDHYDLKLEWTPDRAALPEQPGAPTAASDPEHPSLFTAIQEQLGLKLDPGKGPVEILAIEYVATPTKN